MSQSLVLVPLLKDLPVPVGLIIRYLGTKCPSFKGFHAHTHVGTGTYVLACTAPADGAIQGVLGTKWLLTKIVPYEIIR